MTAPIRSHVLLALTVVGAACSRPVTAPQPATPAPSPAATTAGQGTTPGTGQPAGDSAGGGRAGGPAAQPRPYRNVITGAARSREGLFKTHRVGERVYFEIPRRELGKEMLVVVRPASGGSPTEFWGGGGTRVVAWEREGNRVLLRGRTYTTTADTTTAIYRAVRAQNYGPIIASFPVESWAPDSAAVIEATRLFTSNIPEFTLVNGIQADRSYVEHVASFPDNVNVLVTQTGTAAAAAGPGGGGGAPGTPPRQFATTQRMQWSMVKLPEQPMRARLHDRRVGLGSVTTIDFGRREHEAVERRYVRRYRLEKKNPAAAVSDPIKPIVFWIDPATPEWLKPFVVQGVNDWRAAYEGAGFSNAIEGRIAPVDDPDFTLYDARHSVIYWRPASVANATGGQIVDPRTGEIIKAEVNMYHQVMDVLRDWYFTQVGPLDPRAQRLPLPDSLMGRLVRYVVAHEVGHAIGFPHNMKASAMYPADSLRSAAFLRRMGGHVSTLMDYSRFNYVAQPEDNIPTELLVPDIGPYDRFAIAWQNTPIPDARTPDEEKSTLDRWARVQDTIPWLRFETQEATADPQAILEAVGDADAPKSSRLGLRNLQRVMRLIPQVAERPGENYELMQDLYENAIGQWGRYNSHVASSIGGAETFERYGTGERFRPMSEAVQRNAMRYLEEHAFTVPTWLIDRNMLRRVEQEGIVNRIRGAQAGVVNSLLSAQRLNRLVEYEVLATPGESLYTLPEMLADVRRTVWTELSAGSPRVDIYRRGLHRSYLEAANARLNPPQAPPGQGPQQGGPQGPQANSSVNTDVRPALRGELLEIDRMAATALGRTADAMTRLHLRDVRLEIERILRPDRPR